MAQTQPQLEINRLASKARNKLQALQAAGFTGRTQPVVIPRESGARGASR
jgi:hypothetical protein